MSFAEYLGGAVWLVVAVAALAVIANGLRSALVPSARGSLAWTAGLALGSAAALIAAWLLGSFGLLRDWSYLCLVVAAAIAFRFRERIRPRGAGATGGVVVDQGGDGGREGPGAGGPGGATGYRGRSGPIRGEAWLRWACLAVAAIVVAHFSIAVRVKLGTGMTGFDSTWYHGPLSAGFAQTGDTFSLHLLAPQFMTWFYPQNSELFGGIGDIAFGNDLLTPLLNFGWLLACLAAAWCLGRPYGRAAAALAMAGVAVVLGSGAMADQAGEARNDIVGLFFLLASLAILAHRAGPERGVGAGGIARGVVFTVALAAGIAAGTKVNFLPAAAVVAAGAVVMCRPGERTRSAAIALGGALLGGGYWYLRNLIHSGNPLPWIDSLGPIPLPGPEQVTGGRQSGSVWGYLGDGSVISDWFLPGLRDGFGAIWPLLAALALAGIALCLLDRGRGRTDGARRITALAALALGLTWVFVSTSAPGPDGHPTGFVSGLRYLAPALAVAMAALACWASPRGPRHRIALLVAILVLLPFATDSAGGWPAGYRLGAVAVALAFLLGAWLAAISLANRIGRVAAGSVAAAGAVLAILAGQVVQSNYFESRYAHPGFSAPGLDRAFAWAQGVTGSRIGTDATRQYPLLGPDLSNRVGYVGLERPEGGFVDPPDCPAYRRAVNRGGYRYLVASWDRLRPGGREYPPEAGWIATDPAVTELFRTPPTVVFRVDGRLDPSACPEPDAGAP